jgi:Xaa-Pro aminopeptidase
LLGSAFPFVALIDATTCLARLRSVMTDRELSLVRRGCAIAREAFLTTPADIKVGMREFDIAARLRSNLAAGAASNERCDGFAYCMSGPNSALAYAAFQQTRPRTIEEGDFVLLHCNSYCGGLWTDITRTFSIGARDVQKAAMADAVLEASRKAINAVRPGIRASIIDDAAREVLNARGYGKAFKHATGHGVGFAAINHNALPKIHPLSDEILEPGMVFNIEPAVYIAGLGGMRECNMVAVTDGGAELLTVFQNETSDLSLQSGAG